MKLIKIIKVLDSLIKKTENILSVTVCGQRVELLTANWSLRVAWFKGYTAKHTDTQTCFQLCIRSLVVHCTDATGCLLQWLSAFHEKLTVPS